MMQNGKNNNNKKSTRVLLERPISYDNTKKKGHQDQQLFTGQSRIVPNGNYNAPYTVNETEHHNLLECLQQNASAPNVNVNDAVNLLMEKSSLGVQEAEEAWRTFSYQHCMTEDDAGSGGIDSRSMLIQLAVPLDSKCMLPQALLHSKLIPKVITHVDIATYSVIKGNRFILPVAIAVVWSLQRARAFSQANMLDPFCVAMLMDRVDCIQPLVNQASNVDYIFDRFIKLTHVLSDCTVLHMITAMFRTNQTLSITRDVVLGAGLSVAIRENDAELLRNIMRRYDGKIHVDGRTRCRGTACVIDGTDRVWHEPPALVMAVMAKSAALIEELVGRCPLEHIDDLFVGMGNLTFWQLLWQREDEELWRIVVAHYYFMKAGLHTSSTSNQVRQTYLCGLNADSRALNGGPPLQYPPMQSVGLTDLEEATLPNAPTTTSSSSSSALIVPNKQQSQQLAQERAMAQRMFAKKPSNSRATNDENDDDTASSPSSSSHSSSPPPPRLDAHAFSEFADFQRDDSVDHRLSYSNFVRLLASRTIMQAREAWIDCCPIDTRHKFQHMSNTIILRTISDFFTDNSHCPESIKSYLPHLIRRVVADKDLRYELKRNGFHDAFTISSKEAFILVKRNFPIDLGEQLRTIVQENIFISQDVHLKNVKFDEPATLLYGNVNPPPLPIVDLGPRATLVISSSTFSELLLAYRTISPHSITFITDAIVSQIKTETLAEVHPCQDIDATTVFEEEWKAMMCRASCDAKIRNVLQEHNMASLDDDVSKLVDIANRNMDVYYTCLPYIDRLYREGERVPGYKLCKYTTQDGVALIQEKQEVQMARDMWTVMMARTSAQLTNLCRSMAHHVLYTERPSQNDDDTPEEIVMPIHEFKFIRAVVSLGNDHNIPVPKSLEDDMIRMQDRVQVDCNLRRMLYDNVATCDNDRNTICKMSPEELVSFAQFTNPDRIPPNMFDAFLDLQNRLRIHNRYFLNFDKNKSDNDNNRPESHLESSSSSVQTTTTTTKKSRPTRRGGGKIKAKRDRAAQRAIAESSSSTHLVEKNDDDDGGKQDLEVPSFCPEPPPVLPLLEDLQCPITMMLFEDPVMLVGDNSIYSRAAITEWLRHNNTSPLHGTELNTQANLTLIPLPAIAAKVERYREAFPEEVA